MKRISIALVLPFVAVAVLVAAGCGGGGSSSVPPDSVAVVNGTDITKSDLEALLNRAKKSYASQKRSFPKAGTAEYQSLETQAVAFLVQRAEYASEADKLKLAVTDKEIQDRITQVKKQYFAGSQAKLDKQLQAQGYTPDGFRADIAAQIVSEKLYDEVTKSVKVTDADVNAYYAKNKTQLYEVPESRTVRHILVKTKAEADKIYAQLKAGADFATLAKKYSLDTGSAKAGGQLTITKGQTVAPFETTAFLLSTNQISKPVKTQFGYHVIQPVGDVKPGYTKSLKSVESQIRSQIEQQKKNDAIQKWAAETKKSYDGNVDYAAGYAPPASATSSTTTG